MIQRISNLAHKVFSRLEGSGDISENISKLTELVKGFTVNDIHFDDDILKHDAKFDSSIHVAPIGYVYLWDSSKFSMGIFIIRNGERLPLHNHPNMHGVLKIIHGTAQISSFTSLTVGESVRLVPKVKSIMVHRLSQSCACHNIVRFGLEIYPATHWLST